jgi:hypothetical protein
MGVSHESRNCVSLQESFPPDDAINANMFVERLSVGT